MRSHLHTDPPSHAAMTVFPSALIAVCRTAFLHCLCTNVALAAVFLACILHTNTSPAVFPAHMCVMFGSNENLMNQMSHFFRG